MVPGHGGCRSPKPRATFWMVRTSTTSSSSGDQLYRMDFAHLLQEHLKSGADVTLAHHPSRQTGELRLWHHAKRRPAAHFRFEEKPKDPALLDEAARSSPELLKELGRPDDAELYQGSMGIYIFNRPRARRCAEQRQTDFGKHIIPASLQKYKVNAYIFQGYWEDIGTVRAFFEANLALTDTVPSFNFFDCENPIYTQQRFLPASKINGANIRRAILADGCIITDAHIDRAVIGIRSVIETGATIRNSVLMGADFYQDEDPQPKPGSPPLGVGRNAVIEGAIIDKNARIGEGVVITPEGKPVDVDGDNYHIRDGVVVIPKGAVISDGTRI